jgi:hypothetical protein
MEECDPPIDSDTACYRLLYQGRRRTAYKFLLTISSRKLIRCYQQVLLLSIKISYLPLVEFMHECTVIAGTTVLFVAHKEGFLHTLKQ